MKHLTAIVTYYHTKTLEQLKRCIDSLDQFQIKWIIVDDHSDNRPPYPHLRTDKNLGPYGAFELALEHIRTPWVMRVDCDDYLISTPVFDESYDAWCNNFGGKVNIDADGFLKKPYAGLTGIVVKTGIMRRVWTSELTTFGDMVIFHRLLRQFKVTKYEKDCYVYISQQPGSITAVSWNIRGQQRDVALAKIRGEIADGKRY